MSSQQAHGYRDCEEGFGPVPRSCDERERCGGRTRSTDHLQPGVVRLSGQRDNEESAASRVPGQPGARSGVGSDRVVERSAATEACWVRRVIGGCGEETESARFAVSETGCGTEPTDLGSPQLASERAVPLGTRTVGSGNRVSVTSDKSGRPTGNRRTEPHTRHRPPCASTTGAVIGRVEG